MLFVRRAWIRERWPTAVRLVVVVAACGAAAWSSVRAGAPAKLPDVAMGWLLLFHVERAAVLLAAIGAVVLVSWRATRGDFPVKLGQVEYAVREAAIDAKAEDEAYEERLRILEALMDARLSPGSEENDA